MPYRSFAGAMAIVATSLMTAPAWAFDDAQYPDLTRAAWNRAVQSMPRFDPSKPRSGQQPPLTPEYQAIFEANLRDMETGGQGNHTVFRCLAWGMPAMMNAYGPIEFIITPDVTYLMIDDGNDSVRRVFTDGRDFAADAESSFVGYSVGKWIDTDGDGRYDLLEVETRKFKGPRVYDNSGLVLHPDNQSVIKERIYLDKADRNILHDDVTVIDHALTRPWTVNKTYKRDAHPFWREDVCAEGNNQVYIGHQNYMLSADGELMPAKKNQAPPDLHYFNQTKK